MEEEKEKEEMKQNHVEKESEKREEKSQENQKIAQRKQKVIKWLKNPYNLLLVAILIFALILRLRYFILVGNQALWWDEASYGTLAKNLISQKWAGTPIVVGETNIRPLLFPIMWAGLIILKFPESAVRFLLEFIPSILSVFFVYLIGKEVFNKKIAEMKDFKVYMTVDSDGERANVTVDGS